MSVKLLVHTESYASVCTLGTEPEAKPSACTSLVLRFSLKKDLEKLAPSYHHGLRKQMGYLSTAETY